VYPRSFADADASGEGDLNGIRSRLPYLADLGVDAIWLSPFYPSPISGRGRRACAGPGCSRPAILSSEGLTPAGDNGYLLANR